MYLSTESQDELVAILHTVYGAPSSCATPPAVEKSKTLAAGNIKWCPSTAPSLHGIIPNEN